MSTKHTPTPELLEVLKSCLEEVDRYARNAVNDTYNISKNEASRAMALQQKILSISETVIKKAKGE